MCQHQGVSSYCGQVYHRGLTPAEKQEVVDTHNNLRSRVAMGATNQPAAADMLELQWDEELAVVAQRHADQCQVGHDCNQCRRVPRFKVGQNVWRGRDSSYQVQDWKYIIYDWFSEIDGFPGGEDILNYRLTPGTGHYTQIVWGETSLVGCGVIIHKSQAVDNLYTRYYVCNYGRGGNRLRRRMYQPGRPCSSCPSYSSCSSSYAGLCSAGNAGVSISTTSFNNNNNNKNKNINNNINNSSSYINRNIISRLQSTSLTTSSRIPRQGSNGYGRPRVDLNPKKEEPRRQPRLSRTRTRIIQRRYNTSCNNLFCQIARIFQ